MQGVCWKAHLEQGKEDRKLCQVDEKKYLKTVLFQIKTYYSPQ